MHNGCDIANDMVQIVNCEPDLSISKYTIECFHWLYHIFIFCDFLFRYLQLKQYIILQSDSEQRLIGTTWRQQDGIHEEVIKTSAPVGVCSAVDNEYEP